MRRNLSKPLDAGVLHGDVRVEALRDGPGDEGGALLLEQFDQPLLVRHQRIDPRCLAFEEPRNRLLLDPRRYRYRCSLQVADIDAADGCSESACFQLSEDRDGLECIEQPGAVRRRCIGDACCILREVCTRQLVRDDPNLTDASADRIHQITASQSRSCVSGLYLERCPAEPVKAETFWRDVTSFDNWDAILDVWSREDDAVHDAAIGRRQVPQPFHFPMRRNLSEPLAARVLVRRIWLEAWPRCRASRVRPAHLRFLTGRAPSCQRALTGRAQRFERHQSVARPM